MSALPPAERTKLARVLGLLGSNHAGERDAAGLAADRIVRGAGLSWDDLLQPVRLTEREHSPHRPQPGEASARADVRFCLRRCGHLTEWEQSFVGSVARRLAVSEGQAAKLRQIADSLRARGPG